MSRVRVETNGPVKTVTLCRPEKRNAMDAEMLDALLEVFTATPGDNDRVIVLRGEGPSFCAGVDLAERLKKPSTGNQSPVEKVFHAIEINSLPTVAVVQGAAIAGGCEIALHCEFVVAADTARFGMSLAQIGLAPTWFLTKKLMEVAGPVATREILMLGDPMPAPWMANHGVICRAVPEDQLDAEAQKIIDRLAANAPLSLRAMKAVIVRELAFRDGIEHVDVDALVSEARGSNDAKEGITARLEKRAPVFTGT
jgi:enoyl-CoA hydratase/carnithine racemase